MFNSKWLAFTLAEVLITLGIIGIVAALTIPNIIDNSEKHATVSKVKEAYSILAQATQQINNDCGGDLTACLANPYAADSDASETQAVASLYKPKLSLAKDCTDGSSGCFANVVYSYLDDTNYMGNMDTMPYSTNARFVLSNGISVGFKQRGTVSYLFWILIDVNGIKPPNKLGKDAFYFYYDNNIKALRPRTGNDCVDTTGLGTGCTAKILQESTINYY